MENNRAKETLRIARKNEFILSVILALAVVLIIGLCAHAQNINREYKAVQTQLTDLQNSIYEIEFELNK